MLNISEINTRLGYCMIGGLLANEVSREERSGNSKKNACNGIISGNDAIFYFSVSFSFFS